MKPQICNKQREIYINYTLCTEDKRVFWLRENSCTQAVEGVADHTNYSKPNDFWKFDCNRMIKIEVIEEIILRVSYFKTAPYSMQCKIRFVK